jgi:hypothetical protein
MTRRSLRRAVGALAVILASTLVMSSSAQAVKYWSIHSTYVDDHGRYPYYVRDRLHGKGLLELEVGARKPDTQWEFRKAKAFGFSAYEVVNRGSRRCMDLAQHTPQGTGVFTNPCRGSKSQVWVLKVVSSLPYLVGYPGYKRAVELQNVADDYSCLDVFRENVTGPLIVWQCRSDVAEADFFFAWNQRFWVAAAPLRAGHH